MVSIFAKDFRLSDILRPTDTDEFSLHHSSSNDDEDIYADRLDVAGFMERPRTLFPFLTKLELEHPRHPHDTKASRVIVLDLLDEVAVAITGSESDSAAIDLTDEVAVTPTGSESGGAGAADIGESFLLAGAGVLALWFGTKASVEQIIETTSELHALKAEKKALKIASKEIHAEQLSSEALEHFKKNIKAIRLENKINRRYVKADRIFSGVLSGVGSTTVAVGTFLEVPLYATEASLAAGGLAISIAAPVISTFAFGVAAQEAHRFYKAHSISEIVKSKIQSSQTDMEREVYDLLKARIDLSRKVSSARAISMTCIAVGAPLTVFGGVYGLGVLLPGIVGDIISGYIDKRKVSYTPQLTWQQKAQLDGLDAIVNAVNSAHQEYALLKSLKNERRLRYPIGRDAPKPFSLLAKSAAFIRRKLKDDYVEILPETTFFTFLQKHTDLAIESTEGVLSNIKKEELELTPSNDLRRKELLAKKEKHLTELSELRIEQTLLERAQSNGVTKDHSMFYILRHLVRNGLFSSYSELLLKNRKLKKTLTRKGVITKSKNEYHVDANKLVLMLNPKTNFSHTDTKLTNQLFTKAQDILLTKAKDNARFRERQLLDFLAAHLANEKESAKTGLSLVDRFKLFIGSTGIQGSRSHEPIIR